MRRREFYWSMYQATSGKQLDDLRTDQVEAIYNVFDEDQMIEWLVWRESYPAWMPLSTFPKLLIELRQDRGEVTVTPPPPVSSLSPRAGGTAAGRPPFPEAPATRTDIESAVSLGAALGAELESDDFDDSLALDHDGAGDGRDKVRFRRVFDVRIISGGQVFENTTLNVSLNGMRLKSPLPKGLPRYFNVEVKAGDEMFQLLCSEVTPAAGQGAFRVRIEANDQVNAFRSALISNG